LPVVIEIEAQTFLLNKRKKKIWKQKTTDKLTLEYVSLSNTAITFVRILHW